MSETKMTLLDTIIPKSDQLNFDDLMSEPITVRVVGLAMGSAEQPVEVKIVRADNGAELRPWKPCKSMRRVLIAAWGSKGKTWIGQSATLFGDKGVVYGGVKVGGIRVSHLSGISEPLVISLTVTRAKRTPYTVLPLGATVASPANTSPAPLPDDLEAAL